MSAYTGTGRLVRLAVRRDRIQLPVWVAGSAVVLLAGAAAVKSAFPTEAEAAQALHAAGNNPTVDLLRGVPVGDTTGALVNFRNLAFMLVLAALMSTFAVVRHSRQNEETGRGELIGAAVVGRHALLTAALAVTVGADLVLGAAETLMLVLYGLPVAGSVAFGAACAAVGMAFAGIAAVAAQLFQSSRAANGFAATAVAVAFLVRGVGDALGRQAADGVRVVPAWPSWLSPFGWGMLVRPFGGERWWVLLLPVALAVGGAFGAFALADRRDLGAGLVPERAGRPAASRFLRGPLGLAWRLHRGATTGWVVGAGLFGLGIGSLGKTVETAFSGGSGASRMLEQLSNSDNQQLVDAFFAAMMNVFGALAAGYVIQVLLRLRSEEAGGPAEALLATATGRVRWAAAHLACAVGGALALLLVAGVATGVGDAAAGGHEGIGTLTVAGLVQLPAALVVAGFVVLVYGGLPRLVVGLAWAGLVLSIACGLFGDLFRLPRAVRDLSPFTHVPALPAADARALPIVALLVVAAALVAAGLGLFRRRDLSP